MVSGYEDYRPNYRLNYENSAPNKRLLSPILGYSAQESKQVHSRPGMAGGMHIDTGNMSGPNKSWQSATHHPLATSTNNIGKALGYIEESMNHSSGLDLRRTRPLEPQSQSIRSTYPDTYSFLQMSESIIALCHDGYSQLNSWIDRSLELYKNTQSKATFIS
nr:hypothetical protein [Tanacetum cinerariifolium]